MNNLTTLPLQKAQQFGLSAWTRIVRREDVCRRPFVLWLFDRSLALQIKIAQEQLAVFREVVEGDQQSGLLVIVVVALRPFRCRQRRVLPVPCPLVLLGGERTFERVGAAIPESLIETADPVVRGRDKHEVTR